MLQGAVATHAMYPFDTARALQALVARLDDEIEAKSMLQSKLAALEEISGSATTLAAPDSSWVRADAGVSTAAGAQNVSNILAHFENERKVFEETRQVRSEGSRSVRSSLRKCQCCAVVHRRSVVARRLYVVGLKLSTGLANFEVDVL